MMTTMLKQVHRGCSPRFARRTAEAILAAIVAAMVAGCSVRQPCDPENARVAPADELEVTLRELPAVGDVLPVNLAVTKLHTTERRRLEQVRAFNERNEWVPA